MGMSKRDFEAMALQLGEAKRVAFRLWDDDRAAAVEVIARVSFAASKFCNVAAASNPAFDRDRFLAFVDEVGTGTRDLDGRKVKVSA